MLRIFSTLILFIALINSALLYSQGVKGGGGSSSGGGGTAATQEQALTATNNTAMITPLSAAYSITGAGGCGIVRTSATVVTIFPGASTSTPCNFQFGDVRRQFTSPATVTLAASSVTSDAAAAWVYVKGDGVIYVGLASTFTAGNVTCSGCTKETPVTDVPANAVGVYKLLAGTTDHNWDTFSSSWTNLISLRQFAPITCSTGATCTQDSNGLRDIQVDGTIATKAGVQVDSYRGGLTTGTSTAYALDLTPDLAAYPSAGTNPCFSVKFDEVSGANPTLSIDGLTGKKLYKLNGTSAPAQIGANELQVTTYAVCWDSALDSSNGGFTVAIGGGSTAVTFAEERNFVTAQCNGGGTATPAGITTHSGAPPAFACFGDDSLQAYIKPADGATHTWALKTLLPSTWTGNVDIKTIWVTNANNTNAVVFEYKTKCFATGEVVHPITWNSASTVTSAGSVASASYHQTTTDSTTLTVTGCAAGEMLHVRISRLGTDVADTITEDVLVMSHILTIRSTH